MIVQALSYVRILLSHTISFAIALVSILLTFDLSKMGYLD